MPDVEDPHALVQYAIENLVWIADEGNNVNARPFSDAFRGLGIFDEV